MISAPSFALLTMMGPMNTHNLLNWPHRNQNLEPVCKFTYKQWLTHIITLLVILLHLYIYCNEDKTDEQGSYIAHISYRILRKKDICLETNHLGSQCSVITLPCTSWLIITWSVSVALWTAAADAIGFQFLKGHPLPEWIQIHKDRYLPVTLTLSLLWC